MGRRGEQLLAGLAGDRPEVCGLGGTVPDNGCGGQAEVGTLITAVPIKCSKVSVPQVPMPEHSYLP